MNALGRMRISRARLIYNTDGNMKSSRAPEPELIRSAMGEKGAKAALLTNLKPVGTQYQDTHSLGEPGLPIKFSKESTSRTRKGFLKVVRRELARSYKVKLLQRQFELHIRKQFPAIILIRSTE